MDKSVMKKLILALALLFAPSLAWGQCNGVFAPGQVCGSAAGGVPGPAAYTPSFPLTIGGLTINSSAAVRSLNVGSTLTAAQPAEFNINDTNAPADSRFCYFGVNVPLQTNNGFINATCGTDSNPVSWNAASLSVFQAVFGATISGNSYNGEWHNYRISSGTGGLLQGLLVQATSTGTWSAGAGATGNVALTTYSNTTRGGFTWGIVPGAAANGVTDANIVGAEIDTQYAAGAGGSKVGLQIADQLNNTTGTSTVAATNTALQIIRVHNTYGWDTGIWFPPGDGTTVDYPVRTTGTLIKSGAGTFAHGVDLSAGTCGTDCFKSNAFLVDPAGVVTGSAFKVGAVAGLSTTKTVRAAGGAADCTLIFTSGLLTGGSC